MRAGRRLLIDADGPLPARVSPGGVAEVLDVLLNALMHGAGITRLAAEQIDGRGVLSVQDDGEGVPEPLERAIFDRDVSTAGSTGLGLPLARALVEADGGRLILARARPAGFSIVLPRPHPAPQGP